MSILTEHYECAWAFPSCVRRADRLLRGIPLCAPHHEEVIGPVVRGPIFPPTEVPFELWGSVVYYVTWPGAYADQVKIGVSTQLGRRLTALRRHGAVPEVLVTESGDHKAERRRHRQFGSLRLLDGTDGGQTELFRRAPQLDDHIAALREQSPDWAVRSKL